MNPTVYFVIPCYNEQEVLEETVKRLTAKMDSMRERGLAGDKSRILLVNDGSKDKTWEIITRLHEENGYVEGARIGGKTATSQTLPRGSGRYIASFLGFAPANDPKVLALVIIHNPQGVYYGGQVAAPVVRQLFENILPYLEKMDYN